MADIKDDVELLSAEPEKVIEDSKPKDDVDDDVALLETEVESDDEPEVEPEVVDEEEKPDVKKDYLPHERPPISAIKKEFPELFKKFPALEHMYFREKEYTEVFPTIAEAKDAAESSQALEDFREDLFQGTGEKFVKALKDSDELDKFSKNYLTNLQKTDKDSYWNAISPILENLVRGFFREGKSRNDENLIASAENLSIYLFNTDEIAKGTKTTIKEDPKEDKRVLDKLADIERREYNSFRISALEEMSIKTNELIDLKKSGLNATMQKLLSKQIFDEVNDVMAKDSEHMGRMNNLWKKAKGNYTNENKSKLVSAYLERAKSLVPSIRRRLLSEALGTSPEESKRKLERVEEVQSRREPGSQGKPSGSSARIHSAKAVDWNKTSDMDLLNGNVTLKNRSK